MKTEKEIRDQLKKIEDSIRTDFRDENLKTPVALRTFEEALLWVLDELSYGIYIQPQRDGSLLVYIDAGIKG